jgi:hypothetical protein
MPAVAGVIFLPPFLLSTWLLDQLPEPTPRDVAERTARLPMNRDERLHFVRRFLPGLAALIVPYILLTAFRDFRDNYMVEVMDQLGYPYAQHQTAISKMEFGVGLGVMAAMALLVFIRDNRRALFGVFTAMAVGFALLGISTALWSSGLLSGMAWLMLLGVGGYLAYVPYNSLLFDRLIASTRIVGTAVFAMYVADACGYTGSVFVQLFKDLAVEETSRLSFLERLAYVTSVVGTTLTAAGCLYWTRRSRSLSEISSAKSASFAPLTSLGDSLTTIDGA